MTKKKFAEFILPTFFSCLAIFIGDSIADVPADFVNCATRRTLTHRTISSVEHFTVDHLTLACLKMCQFYSEDHLLSTIVRSLNVSSVAKIRLPSNQIPESRAELFSLLNTRKAFMTMIPTMQTYESIATAVGTYPYITADYRLLTWYQ